MVGWYHQLNGYGFEQALGVGDGQKAQHATVHGVAEPDTTEQMNWTDSLRLRAYPGGSDRKESACNAGDPALIPGWGRSPGEENGNPLQYSCLENSMDRGTWQATVHGVTKSRT